MPLGAESLTIPPRSAPAPAGPLMPTALTSDVLARLLTAAGDRARAADMIQAAIGVSTPAGVGGRINLVEQMVSLKQELART